MPNLNQVYALKQQFYKLDLADKKVIDYLEKSEIRDVLLKSFDPRNINEHLVMSSFITENLNPSKPSLIEYFDEGREEDVALLFIDITSFSKTISGWSNSKIKQYLDHYYKKIIPIIYKHGGEIEKLMGDGIICVFGKPFLDLDNPKYVYKAEKCAKETIELFYGTSMNVKVAIHTGTINYYKVPGEYYGEYTMIGQPITDLYRLESVSKANAINFYVKSLYDKLGWTNSIFNLDDITVHNFSVGELQGVDFEQARAIKFPGFY